MIALGFAPIAHPSLPVPAAPVPEENGKLCQRRATNNAGRYGAGYSEAVVACLERIQGGGKRFMPAFEIDGAEGRCRVQAHAKR